MYLSSSLSALDVTYFRMLVNFIPVFLLILGLSLSSTELLEENLNPFHLKGGELDFIGEGLGKLLGKSLHVQQSNVWIKYKGPTQADETRYRDAYDVLLKTITDIPKQLGKVNLYNWPYTKYRIWMGDCTDNMMFFYKNLNSSVTTHWNVFFLLVLVPQGKTFYKRIPRRQMEGFFRGALAVSALNTVVVVPLENQSLAFYSYNPFRDKSCKSTTPYLIGNNVNEIELEDLYPRKAFNLMGCSLNILLSSSMPFIDIFYSKDSKIVMEGLEGEILKILSEIMNFTVIPNKETYSLRNLVFDNGTVTGVFQSLRNWKSDVAVGELTLTPNRRSNFPSTLFYHQNGVQLLVKGQKSFNSFELLLHPFDFFMWGLLIIFCILRFVFKTFFQNQVRLLPQPFRRFIWAMWLIVYIFYRSLYEAFFFTYMEQRPMPSLPKDLLEFKTKGYTIISDIVTSKFQYYNTFQEVQDIIMLTSLSPYDTYRLLEESGPNFAALTKKEYLNFYLSMNPKKQDLFHLMPEVLVSDVLCMYFPKFSYLVDPFDYFISRLLDFGIVQHFANKINQFKIRLTSSNQSFRPLTLEDFEVVFHSLILLWTAAVVVFIFELIFAKLLSKST